jgi:hypothetical protein
LAKQTEIPKDDHARRGLIYMQLFQLDWRSKNPRVSCVCVSVWARYSPGTTWAVFSVRVQRSVIALRKQGSYSVMGFLPEPQKQFSNLCIQTFSPASLCIQTFSSQPLYSDLLQPASVFRRSPASLCIQTFSSQPLHSDILPPASAFRRSPEPAPVLRRSPAMLCIQTYILTCTVVSYLCWPQQIRISMLNSYHSSNLAMGLNLCLCHQIILFPFSELYFYAMIGELYIIPPIDQ